MSNTTRELVEVVGVVYPPGAGGGRNGTDEAWTLDFVLRPWRLPNGELDEGELVVLQPGLTEEALEAAMDGIDSYEILRLRVYLAPAPPEAESRRAELVEVLGRETADVELMRRAVELQQPVTVEDAFFGTVTFDRALNGWEKQVEWNGTTVHLYLSPGEDGDLQALLRLAEALWEDAAGWERRLREFAVEELIELKNDTWLDENEEEVTPEQFYARMTLESIALEPGGGFEFTYADGDLFWGHVIQVSGTLTEGPTDAGIAG